MTRIQRITPLLFLLLAACSGTPEAPDWVGAQSAAYPAARYLLGRGEGESAALARDRARADLAKIFAVRVAEDSRDQVSHAREHGPDGATERLEAQSSRRIDTATDQSLEGVEIAASWRDPETGAHHALAVLERQAAAAELRRRIGALDATTELQLARARQTADPLRQIAAAAAAVRAQETRTGLQQRLAIVQPGTPALARWPLERLQADLGTLLARLRIAPQADGSPELAPLLAGAVARAGFTPGAGNAGDYRLLGSLDLQPVAGAVQDGWHWVRGRLDISLIDAAGRTVGTRSWPLKSAAQDPGLARQRALAEVQTLLDDGLRAAVLGFAMPADDRSTEE